MAMARGNIDLTQDQLRDLIAGVRGNPGNSAKVPLLESTGYREWRTWREQFETVLVVNSWGNRRACQEMAIRIAGEAKDIIRDIQLSPAIPDMDLPPIQDLLDQIKGRLIPPADSDMVRVMLKDAKQELDEDMQKWQGRIRSIFMRAHPHLTPAQAETNRDLIDAFILGIACPYTKSGTWEARPDMFQDAGTQALNVAAGRRVLASAVGAGAVQSLDADQATANIQAIQATGNCYICDRHGHRMNQCPDLKQFRTFMSRNRDRRHLDWRDRRSSSSQHPSGRRHAGNTGTEAPTTGRLAEGEPLTLFPVAAEIGMTKR